MLISVKAARVNAKMTQKEVARALDLALSAYQRKENGHVRFYADELALLSQLFGVPLVNFFEVQCPNRTQTVAQRGAENDTGRAS